MNRVPSGPGMTVCAGSQQPSEKSSKPKGRSQECPGMTSSLSSRYHTVLPHALVCSLSPTLNREDGSYLHARCRVSSLFTKGHTHSKSGVRAKTYAKMSLSASKDL